MKKPAERDCLALIPGYSGQAAKLFLSRGEDDRIVGVTVYDLLGHVKQQGDAEAVATWIGEWLAEEAGNRKARRTQLLAQMFICKLAGADIIDWFGNEALRVYGRIVPSRNPLAQQLVIKEPVGPVAAFTPWNLSLIHI